MKQSEKLICPKCQGRGSIAVRLFRKEIRCSLCEGSGQAAYETVKSWQREAMGFSEESRA